MTTAFVRFTAGSNSSSSMIVNLLYIHIKIRAVAAALEAEDTLRTGLRLTTLFRFVYFLNDDMCEILNPFLVTYPGREKHLLSLLRGHAVTNTDVLFSLYNHCDK